MTKIWGPLGWMTLHSVSTIYPANPSTHDKLQAKKFLDLFAATISCNACKQHFERMYTLYQSKRPNFLDSRQEFAIFVFRAHNTVNKKLDKPIYKTVQECIEALDNAITQTSFAEFRTAYITYLLRNWSADFSGDSRMALSSAREIQKMNTEYWTPLENDDPIELVEDSVLEFIQDSTTRFSLSGVRVSTNVGFKGGRLQLGRR